MFHCVQRCVSLCFLLAVQQVVADLNVIGRNGVEASTCSTCKAAKDIPLLGGDRRDTVQKIIHGASLLAAAADGSLAQVPGVGAAFVIPAIQAVMISLTGSIYSCHLDSANALALVTYCGSNYVKTAVVKEVIGYVPFAGNTAKATLTFWMTQGIGQMADRLLRCGSDNSELTTALAATDGEVSNPMTRRLFHLVSDYLGNSDVAAPIWEAIWWQRLKQVLSPQDQEQMLMAIRNSSDSTDLADIVRNNAWNLEVSDAALFSLRERFSIAEACSVGDFVVERLWLPDKADMEALLIVAPHLLHCADHIAVEIRWAVVCKAARLLGGSQVKFSMEVVQQALVVIERMVHLAEVGSMTKSDDPLHAFTSPPQELLTVLSFTFAALVGGEAAACGALRALLRIEARSGLEGVSWVSAEHLEKLDRVVAPAGSQNCISALRSDLVRHLTLDVLPAGLEDARVRDSASIAPSVGGPGVPRSPSDAVAVLESSIVGQRCAVERLTREPGFMRVRLKGLSPEDKPLVLLFLGPSGTGKTLLARKLAEALHGQSIPELESTGLFRTFNMNELSQPEDKHNFFGPPKGTVGSGDLPDLLKAHPNAVVLLDEVEKAHSSFAKALLQVFGENGAVYDPRTGQNIPTTKATFILTSNLAKDFIMRHDGSDDQDPDCSLYSQLQAGVHEALRDPQVISFRDNFFRESELRSRLTDVIPFRPFSQREVEKAARRFLIEEAREFAKLTTFLEIELFWEPSVVTLLALEYQRRPEEGLRGMKKKLQAQVRRALERGIESGLLHRFSRAVLRVHQVVDTLRGGVNAQDTRRLDLYTVEAKYKVVEPLIVFASENSSTGYEHSIHLQQVVHPAESSSYGLSSAGVSNAHSEQAVERDWEWNAVDWDWEWNQAWDWLWDVVWEWRYFVGFCTILTAGAAFGPALVHVAVPSALPVMACAGAPAATVVGMAPSLLAVAQLAIAASPVVGTGLTFAFLWTRRQEVAALGAGCVGACVLLYWTLSEFRQWWSGKGQQPDLPAVGMEEMIQQLQRRSLFATEGHLCPVVGLEEMVEPPRRPALSEGRRARAPPCGDAVQRNTPSGHDSISSNTATLRGSEDPGASSQPVFHVSERSEPRTFTPSGSCPREAQDCDDGRHCVN